ERPRDVPGPRAVPVFAGTARPSDVRAESQPPGGTGSVTVWPARHQPQHELPIFRKTCPRCTANFGGHQGSVFGADCNVRAASDDGWQPKLDC
ncbi:hypothetical protein BaRGS_00013124, partial [Batillaria attramentaria]